jgi:retinol dehydrogenase 12
MLLMRFARVSPFVTSEEGTETQKRVWAELSEILEKIQPGIMANI